MRVAIVHDWLLGMRGGERVLEIFSELFPGSDIYTLFYKRENITEVINSHAIQVSSLNKLPGVHRYYRNLLPFYPLATKDLSLKLEKEKYDLVISISHCVAKNITVPKGTFHLCYCLTPMRYIWDKFDDYFKGKRLEKVIRKIADRLQVWDRACAENVDSFVCISEFVKARIASVYQKKSAVIYPPVPQDWIHKASTKDTSDYFLCANALVPYKNTKYVVEAFNELELPLVVLGKGPEATSLKQIANSNVKFIEYLPDHELAVLYNQARALVFAAEEDFGMIPVEIQAAGRPVICLSRGGALETVTNKTGIFFNDLGSISSAVREFIKRENEFSSEACREQALKFSKEVFLSELENHLNEVGFSRFPVKYQRRAVA